MKGRNHYIEEGHSILKAESALSLTPYIEEYHRESGGISEAHEGKVSDVSIAHIEEGDMRLCS